MDQKDHEFLNTLIQMRDDASRMWNEHLSLESAAKAHFFFKFMNRKDDEDHLGKFSAVCSVCGGRNNFYGTKPDKN